MFKSELKVKVRYAETDMMGVVYHANYFIWMELARTKFAADVGFSYQKDMEEKGFVSPIIDVQATYKKPLVYGEEAVIYTWVERSDGLRITYGHEIYKPNGELACTGFTSNICVKKDRFRPVPFRKAFPQLYEKYEEIKKPIES